MSLADTKKCHPHPETEGNVITCRGRSTFVALDRPFKSKKSKNADDKGSYTVALAIPPDCDIALLRSRVKEVAKAKWPGVDIFSKEKTKNKGKKQPILVASEALTDGLTDKDGDEIDLEGWTVIRCNSKRRPIVRNSSGEIVDTDELPIEAYSGRWMRLEVSVYPYENESDGVTFGLEAVQLLKHDAKLGGFTPSTGDGFAAVEEDEDDPLG